MAEEYETEREGKKKNGSPLSRRRFVALTGTTAFLAMAGSALVGLFSSGPPAVSEAYAMEGGIGKPKNILIITGSARVQGNSQLLAEAFAKGAGEAGHTVNIFHSGRDRMSGCLNCGACWSTGNPCIMSDSFDKLWPLLERADMLVFSSPLYMYSYSGHIKNVMDRLYPYTKKSKPRALKIKEAMLLMCCESWFEKSLAGPAESYRQMLGYFGWKDRGRLFVTRIHEKGEIAGNSSLKTAEKMGREA